MKSCLIAFAQMNPVVGDFTANRRRITGWIRKAEREGARMIVFPELALSGYPVWDLANKPSFLEANRRSLNEIVKVTRGKKISVFLGSMEPAGEARRNRSYNSHIWIRNGKVKGVQRKRLLPTYDVFLEEIFFEPGTESRVWNDRGLHIGPTVCEDMWDDNYTEKPARDLARLGAGVLVNISASPYYRGVAGVREEVMRAQAVRHGLPVIYVNQTGGQDDLVFDGRSFYVNARGHVVFRAPAFREGLYFFDAGPEADGPHRPLEAAAEDPAEMYEALTLGVRDYCRKNGFKRVLLGMSGGIDSALTAAVAVDALGPKAVCGITMPSRFSSQGSWKDSGALAAALKMELRNHSIKGPYRQLLNHFWAQYRREKRKVPAGGEVTLAMENLQARIRGLSLMFWSNHENRLLVTTGNKSELAMGYCTLYGDMAGGLCVLGDVYKSDVYRLARWRNRQSPVIPEAILDKPPSAELRPGQKDEDSLPAYPILDEILCLYIEENRGCDEIIRHMRGRGFRDARSISEVIRKVDHNEYKRRQTPPVIRVTRKAWFGRRMPITNRFRG